MRRDRLGAGGLGRIEDQFSEEASPRRIDSDDLLQLVEIARALSATGVRLHEVGTLERAVAEARAAARPGETVLLSPAILREYEVVLPRPRLKLTASEVSQTLNALRTAAEWVEPDFTLHVTKDEPDNRFLECAVAGQANRRGPADASERGR